MWLPKCKATYKQGGFSEKQVYFGQNQYVSSVHVAQTQVRDKSSLLTLVTKTIYWLIFPVACLKTRT